MEGAKINICNFLKFSRGLGALVPQRFALGDAGLCTRTFKLKGSRLQLAPAVLGRIHPQPLHPTSGALRRLPSPPPGPASFRAPAWRSRLEAASPRPPAPGLGSPGSVPVRGRRYYRGSSGAAEQLLPATSAAGGCGAVTSPRSQRGVASTGARTRPSVTVEFRDALPVPRPHAGCGKSA
ncbi:hypothetical protein NDU88_000319 [Pleurodeles waltl]|uniref:Uncharacterized protein n=1 Tax=Pleurodeles waltl TaxID=8319 RepID=A0AAV7LI83_PLEWA|nr:hypothetical protein NDU88_000319 [Pleurodeles waltl]